MFGNVSVSVNNSNSIKSYVNGNIIACCGSRGCFIANVIRSFGKSRRFAVPARFRLSELRIGGIFHPDGRACNFTVLCAISRRSNARESRRLSRRAFFNGKGLLNGIFDCIVSFPVVLDLYRCLADFFVVCVDDVTLAFIYYLVGSLYCNREIRRYFQPRIFILGLRKVLLSSYILVKYCCFYFFENLLIFLSLLQAKEKAPACWLT